jgi:hypothetical protein
MVTGVEAEKIGPMKIAGRREKAVVYSIDCDKD